MSSTAMAAHLLAQLVGDGGRERAAISGESMRRGRSMTTGNSWITRPGRLESSTTRSPSRTASRTLWVTNTMVRPVSRQSLVELVVEHVARHRVECAERLVHQKDVDVLGERARQCDTLPHAARQLVRSLVAERPRGSRVARSSSALGRVARAFETLANFSGSSTLSRAVSHGNSAASWNSSVVRSIADVDVTGARRVEPGDDVEQGALPAAGRAEQADELAAARRRATRCRARGPRPAGVPVDLRDVVERDGRTRNVGLGGGNHRGRRRPAGSGGVQRHVFAAATAGSFAAFRALLRNDRS